MSPTNAERVDSSNLDQLRAWDGEEGAYWADHAEYFDRSVTAHHSRLLAAAAIGAGDRVLDVGCGTGQTTRDAARAASAGTALGVDLSSRMLDYARRRAAEEGLANATFTQADAQIHPFEEGAFDVAISRFAAMFFGDQVAALGNIGRALRPGGRLVLTVWQSPSGNEWVREISGALAAGRDLPVPPPDAGPFSFAGPERVQAVLSAAGFADIELSGTAAGMWFGNDADDAHRFVLGLMGWMLEGLDEPDRVRAIDALRATMADHETPDGVLLECRDVDDPGDTTVTVVDRDSTTGGFSQVDLDPETAVLIAALDEQASFPAVQRLRVAAAELLRPRLGSCLLDVGCGTGDVVRALARLVGVDGKVIGVDPSTAMLDAAHRRTNETAVQVDFRAGDITRLEFADETFDGVICERVMQHLADPELAIGELARVTRAGGRVVVIDTDWGMHAIHGADPGLTARIVDCWSRTTVNGHSGRRLPSLFAEVGIHDPTVVADTLTTTDPRRPTMAPFTVMANAAAAAGAVTRAEAASWLDELARAGAAGSFFWAVTMFAVGGVRP